MKKIRILLSCMLIFSFATLSTIHLTNDIHRAQAASAISLKDKAITLELGHYKTLRIQGTTQKATWYSKNLKAAKVASDGRVTAMGWGTTTVGANVGGKTLTCKVTIVQMNKKNLTLAPGSSSTLTLWGAVNKVTWTSSDSKVATVDGNGYVTGIASGTATITATVDGTKVTSKVTVADISDKAIVMEVGGWAGNVKTLKIAGTSDKITWSSSNEKVATVSSTGRVTAKNTGSATITAKVNGTTFTTAIHVLTMNNRAVTLKKGQTYPLEVLGAKDTVSWDSYKKSVATVSDNGTVTAVSAGQATIVGVVDGRIIRSRITVTD